MNIRHMTDEDAIAICDWEYPGEYDIYNIGGFKKAKDNSWGISKEEIRVKQFRSVLNDNGELIGYFRFKTLSEKVILGLGLAPEICGKGIGKSFMKFILNTEELKDKLIELEVREFNKRAINCYLSAGFNIIAKEEKETLNGKDIFVIMEKKNI